MKSTHHHHAEKDKEKGKAGPSEEELMNMILKFEIVPSEVFILEMAMTVSNTFLLSSEYFS